MRIRPISPPRLVEEIADRIAAAAGATRAAGVDGATGANGANRVTRDTTEAPAWVRVAVDGAPPARPEALADALEAPLRLRGHDVVRVRAGGFLRPASLRFEHGRTDPDVFYDEWLDTAALVREVLGPLAPGGDGRVLPALWDSVADRATRAAYVTLRPGGVLLLDGALLLGRGLPLDLCVHLWLSPGALARKIDDGERWTLPAYERYEREVAPGDRADLTVRVDHPGRPAIAE